jgi:redox-sensitive bicupin YhaK (pirin superfamily)
METLKRGEVQYLSAGDGIYHSEYNIHETKDLRVLQMWIIPPGKLLPKLYGSYRYKDNERKNKLLNIVSNQKSNAPIKIYQNVNIFVSELDENRVLQYELRKDKQVYFVQIEGSSEVNKILLNNGDAMEVIDKESLTIKSKSKSHILFIEMDKD